MPIKAPVAGISCGLIQDGEKFQTFIDIQGVEDFHGEMDFKVAGTKKGITAIQMDLKTTAEICDSQGSFGKVPRGENSDTDEAMLTVIPEPRRELAKTAQDDNDEDKSR